MTSQILSIPFATGIDQSLSTAVGEARITRMHNARLIAPGKVGVSPGYFQASTAGDMRAVAQVEDKICAIRSAGGLLFGATYSQSETRVYSNADETVKWSVPAFEAPTRINFPECTATWCAPTSPTHPDRWMMLCVKQIPSGGGEAAYLYLMKGATVAQQVDLGTSYSTVRYRLVTNYATGYGYLIKVNMPGTTISIYSVSIGDTPLVGSSVIDANLNQPMIDVAAGNSGSKMLLAVLLSSGRVCVYYNDPPWTANGTISAGATTEAIAADGTELLTYSSAGSAATYNMTTLAAMASATTVGVPNSVVALSKKVTGGKYYVSVDKVNSITGEVDSYCYSMTSGTSGGALPFAVVSYYSLSALPANGPLLDASGNVYQVTINRAPVSRSLQIARVHTYTPLRTRRALTAAHGEMPLFSMSVLQGGLASTLPAATPQQITITDDLCGEPKRAYVVASTYVTSGTLTETTAKTAGMALLFCDDSTSIGDSTHCATGYDALSVTRTAYGQVMSAGAPFIVGARGMATGAAVDLPVPVVTQIEATSGTNRFSAGQVYQYVLQYEYRSPDGTLFRGPPSDPITHTVVAPTAPNTTITGLLVSIAFTQESPEMPGLRMRAYRTENGGSIFYDTGAADSPTTIGIHQLTDQTSDATLISRQALTDGAAVVGGIKARYGFPPHRCAWTGRDRIIVGGLENPRRVRWSLLKFSGEAIAFPHASEQGWAADVDDDVTAVAQLDDAWIVFSRTHIWSIYGAGPDDNGLSGGFDPPRLISPNLGCVTWKSLAEIEGGLLFQAADGQIYLLQRGQLTLQWFSARVRDELSSGVVGTRLKNPVVAVIPHDAGQTIHFVRAPLPGGTSPILVYDRRTDAWTTDGDGAVEGLNGAIGGASIRDIFSTSNLAQQTVCTLTPTYLTLENATGTPMAPLGSSWYAFVETNDVAPFGLGGWGKVQRIGAILDTTGTATINVVEWLSRSHGTQAGNGIMAYATAAADFPFMSWAPAHDKCSAVKVQLSWNDTGAALVGLVLSVEQSQGAERLAKARKV